MSLLLQRVNNKDELFKNGKLIPDGVITPKWTGTFKEEKVRPQPRFLFVAEGEDDVVDEEMGEIEVAVQLDITSTNGDLITPDNRWTRLIPRMTRGAEPLQIDNFKWYKNGEEVVGSEKYLTVTSQDFGGEQNNIFTIKTTYKNKDYSASISIIRLKTSFEDKDDREDESPDNSTELILSGNFTLNDFNVTEGYAVPRFFTPNFTPRNVSFYGMGVDLQSYWGLRFQSNSNLNQYELNTAVVPANTELTFNTRYGFLGGGKLPNPMSYVIQMSIGNYYLTADHKWRATGSSKFDFLFQWIAIPPQLNNFTMNIPPTPMAGSIKVVVFQPSGVVLGGADTTLRIDKMSLYYE